ncbi:hypothetical protein SGO26_01845 [Cupriavidus metallidurans]|uniref:hypothetical protein n=1 Tax=Cupriavidus TaxID=106589 RepID=UPI00257D1CF8|nr:MULTISPECIES: hypothetical protein [unclassified Cupriavidus]GMG95093.1 hypothetical protein Cmtc_63130 [Cupriavidus sp. TKC]
MTENDIRQAFRDGAAGWLCDGYAVKVSYVARTVEQQQGSRAELWGAMVAVSGEPPREGIDFEIQIDDAIFGHTEYRVKSRGDLEEFLQNAALGILRVRDQSFWLADDPRNSRLGAAAKRFEILSERDTWFSPLHYRVRADFQAPFPTRSVYALDTALRRADPPFDGLADVAQSLGINIAGALVEPTISISVSPPADLIMESCKLSNNELTLVIHAHPNLEISCLDVSVRAVPGKNMQFRHRVSGNFTWTDLDGRKTGVATVDLEDANSALVMLVVGKHTVRRQWFLDPTKAPNLRLVAMNTFDKDLRRFKAALFDTDQSRHFEQAVAGLLFMLGFIPAAPNETDAPDLIVMTPGGRLVLVECTFKTSEIENKIGKLVDRREALKKAIGSSSHLTDPVAVLVCRVPRENIVHASAAKDYEVLLLTGENLEEGLTRTHLRNDPDQLIEQALAALREQAESVVSAGTQSPQP